MMATREEQAVELFGKVFDELNDPTGMSAEEYRRRRWNFAFHMTDWLHDLDDLHALLADPGRVDTAGAAPRLFGLLAHIAPHVRAAYRALEGRDADDPFLEVEAGQRAQGEALRASA